jgi:8-oxo-dGTP pyrophosphatase MutT (NUDIX family)
MIIVKQQSLHGFCLVSSRPFLLLLLLHLLSSTCFFSIHFTVNHKNEGSFFCSAFSNNHNPNKKIIMTAPTTSSSNNTTVVDARATTTAQPFDESMLTYDHYNGIALDLGKYSTAESNDFTEETFSKQLQEALTIWKMEGRKGIWIHIPAHASRYVHVCIQQGFEYHKILREDAQQILVLSQWLPPTESKLPFGPTHQVGVGVVVLNPNNKTQMLAVQEKTGPAASYKLWKMPTGLLDPNEDVPDGAVRELYEETGLKASLKGIICFRQAHRPGSPSDLFFVCLMELDDPNNIQWKPQEDEIDDIRWMSVEEYCNQQTWKGSPLYRTLNQCIWNVSKQQSTAAAVAAGDEGKTPTTTIIDHQQLEVGLGREGMTNALFTPPVPIPMSSSSSSSVDQSKL